MTACIPLNRSLHCFSGFYCEIHFDFRKIN